MLRVNVIGCGHGCRTSAELMAEVKRSEMLRLDAEHEATRLRAALDRQAAECREMQVLCCFLHYIKHIL